MSTPEQPQGDNDGDQSGDAEMAKAAGKGCLAGLGVVGLTLLTIVLLILGAATVGLFLLYLACSGH